MKNIFPVQIADAVVALAISKSQSLEKRCSVAFAFAFPKEKSHPEKEQIAFTTEQITQNDAQAQIQESPSVEDTLPVAAAFPQSS